MEKKEFLYQAADEKLKNQLNAVDSLITKISILLGVAGVLLTLFVGLSEKHPLISIFGVCGNSLGALILLINCRVIDWHSSPTVSWLAWQFKHGEDDEILDKAISDIENSYTHNAQVYNRIAKRINWAIICMTGSILLAGVIFLIEKLIEKLS